MGKNEDDHALSSLPTSASTTGDGNGGGGVGRCGQCRSIGRIVSLRCLASLAVGVAVLLSALFWLPPFLGGAHGDSDPQYGGAVVVASFKVPKPISLVNANSYKLRYDIFEEIGFVNSTVDVISVELGGPNLTNVVFGIWPYPKTSTISSMELSIVRSNFMSFVIRQTTLHLTTSLFGSPSFFQVLKFPGGITIIPQQSVFLLQKVQVLFSFTLNFPIYQVQDKLNELESQMKSGLHLNYNENLYVRLTNLRGSTVAPPTVVQTSVVLAVGNKPPSIPRLRQLAQNIRGSSKGNLGLNHTVFGKVKQIRLSSILPLNSGGNGISMPPSPAPQPHTEHHHHRHYHRHHRSDVHFAPAPAPQHPYKSPAPSGCHFAARSNPKIPVHIVPAGAPVDSPHYSPVPPTYQNLPSPSPTEYSPSPSPVEDPPAPVPSQDEDPSAPSPQEDPPVPAPSPQEDPPVPAPHLLPTPLPHVSSAHARPPSEDLTYAKPPDRMSSISPSPSLSSVAGQPSYCRWVLVALLYMFARL